MAEPSEIGFIGTAAIGAWEVCKLLFGALLKRRGDKADKRREVLRADLTKVSDDVNKHLAASLEYFTGHCDQRRLAELARSIRHGVGT